MICHVFSFPTCIYSVARHFRDAINDRADDA